MDSEIKRVLMQYFPSHLRASIIDFLSSLSHLAHQKDAALEEIRVRVNSPLMVLINHITHKLEMVPGKKDIEKMIHLISDNSLYSYQEEIVKGFITISGGHRVGVVGKVHMKNGQIKSLKDISGINVRFSREVIGAANHIATKVCLGQRGIIGNTLIVGPPGCGKTTLLRDLARIYSNGELGLKPHNVSIIDERSELAGSVKGIPQKQVGIRTDVMDSCPKAIGIMMVIRSMSPDLIVTDEIGRAEDVKAVWESVHAGVKLLLSAHGESMEALRKRPGFQQLIDHGVFDRVVMLSRKNGPGTVDELIKTEDSNKKTDYQRLRLSPRRDRK